MTPNEMLTKFLEAYHPSIQEIAIGLREFVIEQVPTTNELIWDNYNALAIAYSKSKVLKDAFCHIALYRKHVNFGFNRGAELTAGEIALEGKGKLIRHIKVTDLVSFPRDIIREMLLEAVQIADLRNPELGAKSSIGESIVMSISKKQRR